MPRRSEADKHGIILIDKPTGWTSHDIVARLRRLLDMKKIGHAGTLDPFATGVLVVACGKATRLLRFAQDLPKTYLAQVMLGTTTDSADRDGNILTQATNREWPKLVEVQATLENYVGRIDQRPPAYSAVRVEGKRAYDRARAGEDVDVPVRSVDVHDIDLIDYSPPSLTLSISCSTGTYIRSIARDIGEDLDTGAYCHELRRTTSGRFQAESAWCVNELESVVDTLPWRGIACHPDVAVWPLPAVFLDSAASRAWYHGRLVGPEMRIDLDQEVRVYTSTGSFAGIGLGTTEAYIKPRIVFSTGQEGLGS